jgi:hypothetical protein
LAAYTSRYVGRLTEGDQPSREWLEVVIAACDRVLDDLASEAANGAYPTELAFEVDALRLRLLRRLEDDSSAG